MKKNLKSLLIIVFFLIILTFILLNSNLIINEIINIFNVWFKRLFPSLFPFFIIGDILINYNFHYYLGTIFNPLFKLLFNTGGNISFIFLLSIFSGFPSNAKYTKELYLNKYINNKEAAYALAYTFFANPLFIINMTREIFNSSRITLIILLSHYLSNVFIGLIFRFKNVKTNNIKFKKQESLPFNKLLTSSINKNINTLLSVLGIIILFVILSTWVTETFNLSIFSKSIINGILELTQGINSLRFINVSTNYKMYLMVTYLGFGGLSVHMQIKSILEDTNISLKPFYIGRIVHIIISIIIIRLLI